MKTFNVTLTRWLPVVAAAALCNVGFAKAEDFSPAAGPPTPDYIRGGIAGASCGGTPITQNTNPDMIVAGTVECASGGGAQTTDNAFARSYVIPNAINVNCVDFGIQTSTGAAGGNWPVRVRLYKDTNGGPPDTASLVQLGPDVFVTIPNGTTNTFFTATFPGGVAVPAGTTLVVELFVACRQTTCTTNPPPWPATGDGFATFFASNNLGQSAPTYLKAAACGAADFANLANLGFPNVHIIQQLGTTAGGGNPCQQPLPACRADVAPPGGDGTVNTADLLAVINTWGGNGGPPRPQGDCSPLPNGDCIVNTGDLLTVINSWGACPPATGACCMPNGTCVGNQSQAQCSAAFGTYQGNNTVCNGITCPVLPANDECPGAIAISNGVTNINNSTATTSTNPPPPGAPCIFGGAGNFTHDLWYTYTATCTGNLTVDACATTGTVTDTVMALYSGSCASPTEIACDDDSCGDANNLLSSATISVTTGDVIRIRIGTWGGSPAGAIALTVTCAVLNNDNCSDATPVAIGGSVQDDLSTATPDVAPQCGNVTSIGQGRWFTVIGNGHTLTASTCASGTNPITDTQISVYCGSACSSLFCVDAVDNNSCSFFHETLSWCSAIGQKYWILVSSNSAPGAFTLSVSDGNACGNPPTCGLANDSCAGAFNVTANINGPDVTFDNTLATPPQHDGNPAGADPELPVGSPSCQFNATPTDVHNTIWYKVTVPTPAPPALRFDTCGSAAPLNDTIIAVYTGSCGALVEKSCDDDSCTGAAPFYSRADVLAPTAGQTLFIMVGNTGSYAGSVPGPGGVLHITTFTPCSLVCPGGSTAEGEACPTAGPDAINGGCNSTPAVFGTIVANGPAICGTGSTFTVGTTQTRDTDWFKFTVTTTGTYHIQVSAEFTALVGFVPLPCPATAFVAGSTATTAGNCQQVDSPAVSLTPGDYAVFVGPTVFTGFPCSSGINDYWVKLITP